MSRLIKWSMRAVRWLVRAVYLAPFVAFALWMIVHVYVPNGLSSNGESGSGHEGPETTMDAFERIALCEESPIPRSHFHMVDSFVDRLEIDQAVCAHCHGTYPHAKDDKLRALLNMHTGFMDCSVCHTGAVEVCAGRQHGWIERGTGRLLAEVEGSFGRYQGRIYPLVMNDQGRMEPIRAVTEESAAEYLRLRNDFGPDQNAQAKALLHGHLAPEPVHCSDCHAEDGCMDFEQLRFGTRRSAYLNSAEVAGMIDSYDVFYIPPLFEFLDP